MGTNDLFNQMEELRGDEPVLWAVINGAHTRARLCDVLNWPPAKVDREVQALVDEKLLFWFSGHSLFLRVQGREDNPAVQRQVRMKELAKKIREKIFEEIPEMPDFQKERTAIRRQLKASSRPKPQLDKSGLTEKQLNDLKLGYQVSNGGRNAFRAIDVAQKKGYSKAGFTGNTLDAIMGKGYLELAVGTRYKSYIFTEQGKEAVE